VRKQIAYVMSLLVIASALWGPLAPLEAQNVTCLGPGCSGGAGGVTAGANTTFTGQNVFTARTTFGTAQDAVSAIDFNLTTGSMCWEGAAADAAEGCLIHTVNAGFDTTTTIPAAAASQTVALLEAANVFTASNQVSASLTVATGAENALFIAGSAILGIYNDTTQTPDGPLFTTGTTSNSINVVENADEDFDFNNGDCAGVSCTDPQYIIHTAVQDTTQYTANAAWGTAGGARKTLTETTATSTIRIPVAAGAGTGGTFSYCVFASDATDQQQRCGRIKFSVTNKAATETCGLNTDTAVANDASITETEDGNAAAISAGTLTYAITCDTTPANAVDIQINATSSLTQTTLEARYSVQLIGPGQPARQ